jgi:hypothetical protein
METFELHAREVVSRPGDFGVWTWAGGQLEKVVLDKLRRVVQVFIRPTPRYPETLPQVVSLLWLPRVPLVTRPPTRMIIPGSAYSFRLLQNCLPGR